MQGGIEEQNFAFSSIARSLHTIAILSTPIFWWGREGRGCVDPAAPYSLPSPTNVEGPVSLFDGIWGGGEGGGGVVGMVGGWELE